MNRIVVTGAASGLGLAIAEKFLGTASSRHVTGSIWTMDGGFTAH
jgi:NAD(P)-dependent dehydrogenase (short-subunit alcohol dehydrogenase family)